MLLASVRNISDNNLGGWYVYRKSNVALNMFINNQYNHGFLLPNQSVCHLIDVLKDLKGTDLDKWFAWDGSIIDSKFAVSPSIFNCQYNHLLY